MNKAVPRFLAEGAIIVASILLAFWIDAWWEDRQQEKTEKVLLQALLDDLVGKQEFLEYSRVYNRAIGEAIKVLLDEEAHPAMDTLEVDRQIGLTWWYASPTGWHSAPLEAIITAGELFGVSNPRLLQKLSELRIALEELKNVSANDQGFHNDILFPFYIEHANLVAIANMTKHTPGHPGNPYVFPVFADSGQRDNRVLLSNPQFRNLMIAKLDKLTDINLAYTNFKPRLDESVGIIRAELEP